MQEAAKRSDPVRAKIAVEGFWQGNMICSLVILQEAGDNAGQRKRASIQRMDQLCFACRVFETNLHPIGLE